MSDIDQPINSEMETENFASISVKKKSLMDYCALAIATCGVGFIPLAPGTWGSAVGVLIYLIFRRIEQFFDSFFAPKGWEILQISAWNHFINSVLFLLFCLFGIWAASRTAKLLKTKDPQKVVVDEVIGQLIVFLFVPFDISWKLILAGFLLFRLFDIWKPYPINSLETLPAGLGICADDILAGVYGGVALSFIYAISLTF